MLAVVVLDEEYFNDDDSVGKALEFIARFFKSNRKSLLVIVVVFLNKLKDESLSNLGVFVTIFSSWLKFKELFSSFLGSFCFKLDLNGFISIIVVLYPNKRLLDDLVSGFISELRVAGVRLLTNNAFDDDDFIIRHPEYDGLFFESNEKGFVFAKSKGLTN